MNRTVLTFVIIVMLALAAAVSYIVSLLRMSEQDIENEMRAAGVPVDLIKRQNRERYEK
jgi:hypothetical protein